MRLINTSTFQLHTDSEAIYQADPRYAILSHRWVPPEITFRGLDPQELARGSSATPQLQKIRGACQTARNMGLAWIWIDTCCINKESTVEETESINSMFKWYRAAQVCLVYLSDVDKYSSQGTFGHKSRSAGREYSEWFERGWTLQELLAPRDMQFYDCNWQPLGSKKELARELSAITRIDAAYLRGEKNFRNACIAQKMSWMATRTTTREEDMAYSLLGVFDVSLTPQYGEGKRAFVRLEKELMATVPDESLFAWTRPLSGWPDYVKDISWSDNEWGLLAPSAECFRDAHDVNINGEMTSRATDAFTASRSGIHLPVPMGDFMNTQLNLLLAFIPPIGLLYYFAMVNRTTVSVGLNCWHKDAKGRRRNVAIKIHQTRNGTWLRTECDKLFSKRTVHLSRHMGSPYTKNCEISQPVIEL